MSTLVTSGTLSRPEEGELASIDRQVGMHIVADAHDVASTPSTFSRIGSVDQASRLRTLVGDAARTTEVRIAPAFKARQVDAPPQRARTASVVTVASGKGGVGKTNVAVNLAIALAGSGFRVTLLDADLGTANADVLCGVQAAGRLDHVLGPGSLLIQDGGRRSVRDIAVPGPGGIRLVPGASGISRLADLGALERRALLGLIQELEADADVIVIDAAAGIGRTVTTLLHASDLGIIVTTPEPTALADAYALTKSVALADESAAGSEGPLGTRRLGLVVNQATDALEGFSVHARFTKVCRRFLGGDVAMLGFIAQDLQVPQSVRAQVPLLVRSPGCPAAHNLLTVAGEVVDSLGLVTQPKTDRPSSGGFARLVRRLLGG